MRELGKMERIILDDESERRVGVDRVDREKKDGLIIDRGEVGDVGGGE